MPSEPIRLLIVAAHPADAFDQAGGTLAHHVAEGDQVSALILTGGARSHDWKMVDRHLKGEEPVDVDQESDEAHQQKTDETRRACAELGITDLHFFGLEDDEDSMYEVSGLDELRGGPGAEEALLAAQSRPRGGAKQSSSTAAVEEEEASSAKRPQ